jgi:hypothetical protein
VVYTALDLYLNSVIAFPINIFKYNNRRRKAWDIGDKVKDIDTDIQPSDYIPDLLLNLFN